MVKDSLSPKHIFSRTISIPTRSDDYSDIDGFQVDVYEYDGPDDETLRERLRFQREGSGVEATIGRDPSNDIYVPDETVSRNHAKLRQMNYAINGDPNIEDAVYMKETSTNGTYVHRQGDCITPGRTKGKTCRILRPDGLQSKGRPVSLFPGLPRTYEIGGSEISSPTSTKYGLNVSFLD